MSRRYIDETRRWLLLAEADLEAARQNVASGRFHHVAGFHAQQAVEKTLKAILIWSGIDPPRIHDLDELRDSVPQGWSVRGAFPDLAELSFWAVQGRYPGVWAEMGSDEARHLVETATRVFEHVVQELESRGFDHGTTR